VRIIFRRKLSDGGDEVEGDSVHTVGERQAIMWTGIDPLEPETLVVTLFEGGQYIKGPVYLFLEGGVRWLCCSPDPSHL